MRARRRQGGFTIIELLIALTILCIGLLGLIKLVVVALQASSFSRHHTEASVLAEDRLEQLRSRTILAGITTETVDARGVSDTDGLFTRTSTVTSTAVSDTRGNALGTFYRIDVSVAWKETSDQTPDHSVTLSTDRME